MGNKGFYLADALEKLSGKKARNGTRHAFLVGNMRERTGSYGHWVGVLVERKNNRIYYYIADSLNQNSYFWVERLHTILNNEKIIIRLRWSGNFVNILETIENRLENTELKVTEEEKIKGNLDSLDKIEYIVSVNCLSNEDNLKKTYFERVSKCITATIKRANDIKDNEKILKRLDELKHKFCNTDSID